MEKEFESMNIGKRILGLYIVKKQGMFESVHQIVPYSTAVYDFVHGTEAFDGTKTHPGEIVTEEAARKRLAKITGDEEGRVRNPTELLSIKLNLGPSSFEYRGRVCSIPNAELLTHYDLYRQMAEAITRMQKTGRITDDFNALAVIFERDTGAIKKSRTKSSRFSLEGLKPVPEPRICLEDRCEIHKVRLKIFRPIYESYVPRY